VARILTTRYDLAVYVSALIAMVIGAATGLVGSLLGIGGGVLLVPFLVLALGVPIRAAIAASLMSVIATGSASATVNLDRGLVNMRLGLALEVATSVGGLTGGVTSVLLSRPQLFRLFAFTLGAMGLLMVLRSGRRNVLEGTQTTGVLGGVLREGTTLYTYRMKRLPIGLLASLVAGAISGLLGLGGGILKVPVLNALCGIPIRVAAATSSFMIGVTAAASAFIYLSRGDVDLPLTAAVVLGTLPTSLLGARLSERFKTQSLKLIMSAVLFIVAARMLLEVS